MVKPARLGETKAMADDSAHFYEPVNGHGLVHDPFNAIIGPRPIGWISSVRADGARNLAPYSFFNAFNYRPPIIGFATVGWKDTVANIKTGGEFVWNLATKALAAPMNATSALAPPEVDEFTLSGLTPAPSRLVAPPRVLESPVNFECRLSQLIQLKAASGALVETWLVLGEVVAVHIDRTLLKDGVYDTAAAHPILRAGKLGDYAEIRPDAMFEMARPNWPEG
jgi:flavin reductase (DIM6/NTAB) family NADH-FMN oxidoreductase RutF